MKLSEAEQTEALREVGLAIARTMTELTPQLARKHGMTDTEAAGLLAAGMLANVAVITQQTYGASVEQGRDLRQRMVDVMMEWMGEL